MRFFTGITKLASRPPWTSEHEVDGQKGFWAELGHKNHPVFLRSRDNRIHLPKSLRGKAVSDIHQEHLDALDKTDSGHTHFKLWKTDFDQKRETDKIYNGYQFTEFGLILLDRWKKFFTKYKLDDVTSLGLNEKYSIDLSIFDKMTSSTDVHKVQRLGRTLAKKYRMIIELLKVSQKTKLATKMDKDFYYNYDKLKKFFDFDPSTYKPSKPEPEEEDLVDISTKNSPLVDLSTKLIEEVQPLVNPQMVGFINAMSKFDQFIHSDDIPKAQKAFQEMATQLTRLIGMAHASEVGKAAEKILTLPNMVNMHSELFK